MAIFSVVLGGLVILACAVRASRLPRWYMRLALAALIYWGFVWLSPQIYYTYYMMIFEGLPLQWVVRQPPALGDIGRLLTFRGPATMSAHGLGILGWSMSGVALAVRK